jgi:pentatricopeptide repeat protein
LEKGLQWERALDLFDEMKMKNMPVTVVSYGSAISACEKGMQYRQCLEYLDEMTEMGIKKNVIIFGAAMSCMEKSCRADIAFQLMERMKIEEVQPNVHIYNSAISACARCNLWEKGYELFKEMDEAGVARDVVTYNAVLDAVSSQVELGRKLFKEGKLRRFQPSTVSALAGKTMELTSLRYLISRFLSSGVEKGFYARVSRLGTQWLELDLHFLSLGGGEIALGWWFEECLVPYLTNTSKLEAVNSISIVTGYGKTRSRGARMNDDGMRKRVRAMLEHMRIKEMPQPNKGRINIDKEALIEEVKRHGGKIIFDIEGYKKFLEEETTANKFPDVPQQVRPRFRPAQPGEGPAGTFIRDGDPVPPYNPDEGHREPVRESTLRVADEYYAPDRSESRRSSTYIPPVDDRLPERLPERGPSSYASRSDPHSDPRTGEDWRGGTRDSVRRSSYGDTRTSGTYPDHIDREDPGVDYRRGSQQDYSDRRFGFDDAERRGRPSDYDDRRGSQREWDSRGSITSRSTREYNVDSRRNDDRDVRRPGPSYYSDDRRGSNYERNSFRSSGLIDRDTRYSGRTSERDFRGPNGRSNSPNNYRASNSGGYSGRRSGPGDLSADLRAVRDDPEVQAMYREENEGSKKRSFDDYQKQQPASRGYDIEPSYSKRRSM